jgi:hypothetical protein
VFPKNKVAAQHEYVIDTITGRLPVFLNEEKKPRDRMNVYQIQNSDLTLLDLQNTTNKVQTAGFIGTGRQLQGNTYRWVNKDLLVKTIDIDIVSKNFKITSPYLTNSTVLKATNLPDQSVAKETTSRLLSRVTIFPADIDRTKTKTQLLDIENGKLVAVEKLPSAKIIRVDYYQKAINTFPMYYPDTPNSSLHFFVASSESFDPAIVSANFFYQKITEISATYPLKPVSLAFDELQKGNAYISADYTREKTIKIKDVLLGYFVQDTTQNYLMPVYVFKGGLNDEFYAFVPAVSDQWIESK